MARREDDRAAERRNQILVAAQKVFGSEGYDKATMDAVAEAAGLSKGSLYNYFKSKQDLFATLFEESHAADETHIRQILEEDVPARRKLAAILDHWFLRFGHFQAMGRLVLEFYATAAADEQSEFSQEMHALYRRFHTMVCRLLADGERRGEFKLEYGPEVGATLLMAAIDGVGLQAQLGVLELTPDTLAALKQAIFDALRIDRAQLNPQEQDHE